MTAIPTAKATLHTNHGDIRLNLFGNHAPKTVDNFIGLATGEKTWTHPATGEESNEPFYNGVINVSERDEPGMIGDACITARQLALQLGNSE